MSASLPAVKTDTRVSTPANSANQSAGKLTIKQHLESPAFAAQVAKALPRHLTPDRFLRVALTAITKTPKLAQCDQASFFSQLLTLSQLGLEPDGRRAHLIPFENRRRGVVECQLIVDWKGLVELAMRSGLVANLHADVIREGDLFEYSAGKLKTHIPHFLRRDADKPKEAGSLFAVYAVAEFRDGSSKADVMSLEEVDAIRARSKSRDNGPWMTDYNEMAKKTVFRRLSKWLPLSPEFRDALDADDDVPSSIISVTPAAPAGGLAAMIGSVPAPSLAAPAEDDIPMGDAQPADAEPEPATASPATTPTATAAQPDREKLITAMQSRMLDIELPEAKAFAWAQRKDLVPEGVDELWALPTAALYRINAEYLNAPVAANGGAK